MTTTRIETKRWTVAVLIDEQDGATRAKARLQTHDAEITGVGFAQCSPTEQDHPLIGDELATARALTHLAQQLFDASADSIEAVTNQRVVVTE